jgi:hypothetical protein
MAARGSFQKRQKESARKEKRQQKLDRRQGRIVPQARPEGSSAEDGDLGMSEESGMESETNQALPVGPPSESAPVHGLEKE